MSDKDKSIRFIDSDYRELFKIPDGEKIKIIYPPDDSRGTVVRACKYLDDYHFRLFDDTTITPSFGAVFHIGEFAERMENMCARYEPEIQLLNAEIAPFSLGEEKFLTYNREEGNTCIGHIAGDFGNDGERFHSHWQDRENGRNSSEFQTELHSAVYALRNDFLENHNAMVEYCKSHPEAKLPDRNDLEHYGFKLDTESRQYFILCVAESTPQDSRFIIYPYDKVPVVELEQSVSDILPRATSESKFFGHNNEDKSAMRVQEGVAEEKPSLLQKIRNSEKAPKPPHKTKAPNKNKGNTEL